MGFRRLSFLLALSVVFAVAACGDNKRPIFEDANTDMGGSDMVDAAEDAPPDAGCPAGQTLCGTECVDLETDGDHCGACDTDCGASTCQTNNGTTICCPTGQTNCNGTCVDLTANDDNCGACGTDCGTGTCQTSGTNTMCCPAGQTNCNGTCIDTSSDNANCGACAAMGGDVCNGTTELCCSGTCVDTNTDEMNCDACGIGCSGTDECKAPLGTSMTAVCCAPGEANCNGVCSNPVVDNNNCGGCGIICGGSTACQAPDSGSQPACCLASQNNCDGTCSDPLTDNMNCGACGNACTGTDTCMQGVCCGPGEIECGGVCVDPDTNPDHCGGCNTAGGSDCATTTPVCSDGTCVATCDTGEVSCNGACVVTDSDPNNCGGCAGVDGDVCAPNEVCNNGTCTTGGCTGGEIVCDGACVDINTDENHCGSCSGATSVCGSTQTCDSGICCDSGLVAVPDSTNPANPPVCCATGALNCNGVCSNPLDDATCGACNVDCGSGDCTDGTGGYLCCPAGTARCGTACVDLTSSEMHCGGCGQACSGSDLCTAATGGSGTPECCDPATELNCGGNTCVDKLENDANCGTCGNNCGLMGMQCSNGECCGIGETNYVVGVNSVCCPAGQISCDGMVCIDLTDNATCGTSCSDVAACPVGEVCNPTAPGATTGVCDVNCGALTNCSGSCVDTNTDVNHCGACDDPCPVQGQTCSGGTCSACPTGPAAGCGGVCVDTSTNNMHCGACAGDPGADTCGTGEYCTDGHCCSNNPVPTSWCDTANACIDLSSDNNNCGSCGNVCGNGETCQGGVCACEFGTNVCPPSAGANANQCRNTAVDPTACGPNCTACQGTEVCVSGGCRATCPPPLTACTNDGDDQPYPGTLLCVNTDSNSSHCGACGVDCPAGTGCSNGSCVPLLINPPPAEPAKCANGGPPIDVPTGGGGMTCTGNLGAVSFLFGLCSRTNIGPVSRDIYTDAFDSNVAPYVPSCSGDADCSPTKLCSVTETICTSDANCTGGADFCDFPVKCIGGTCAGGGIGVNGRVPNGTGGVTTFNPLASNSAYTHVGGDFWAFGSIGLAIKGNTDVKQRLINQGPIELSKTTHVFRDAIVGGGWTASASSTMQIDRDLQTQLPASCASLPSQVNVTGTESCGVPFPALGDPCGAFDNSDGSLLRIADVIVPHFRNPANNDNALIGLEYDAFEGVGPVHLDLPCGIYYLNSLQPGGASTIAVHGRTALIIGGSVRLSQEVYFDLDPDATLDIFVGGVMNVSNNVTLGSPAYPAKTRMYFGSGSCAGGGGTCNDPTDCCSGVCSTCPVDVNTGLPTGPCTNMTGTCTGGGGNLAQAISLSQGGNFNGLLWAGYGAFTHSNPLEMYGAIYARYFDASGVTTIHYDNAAADLGDECPPTQGQACESCRDCNGQACVGNTCGTCSMDSDCCPPLRCNGGSCTL